jgi:hypothetical protein
MKIIKTQYYGPTNKLGARIKADDGLGNKITVLWAYELTTEQNHQGAAQVLCNKFRWTKINSGWYRDCMYFTVISKGDNNAR